MTHGSLFSGIGGFDLAAEWMGWENKFHCEWNPFGQKVLKYYWPEAESFHDITKTDFSKYANTIDILTGGFPCQPYSLAGKRKGKDDDRHLWPEMLRTIREVKPRWVVGENVLGLVNWNGGLVFHEVQSDLEAQGYEVWPFVLPAASVNAPHRRDRVWFVAYSKDNGRNGRKCEQRQGIESNQRDICECRAEGWNEIRPEFERHCQVGTFANSNKQRHSSCGKGESIKGKWCGNNGQSEKWSEQTERFDGLDGFQQSSTDSMCIGSGEGWEIRQSKFIDENGKKGGISTDTESSGLCTEMAIRELERNERFKFSIERNKWHSFPSVSPLCTGDDGLSNRLDSITFPKWRNESIKAGGNAIVPQVAYQIFKSIEIYDANH